MNEQHYLVEKELAAALVNGDYSGLTDGEEAAADLFTENSQKQFGNALFFPVSDTDEKFTTCEVTQTKADCVTIGVSYKGECNE